MHGAVPYSIVGVREAIIRAARVSKELIHSALISAAIHRPCACAQTFWLGGPHCLVTTNTKKKKIVLKGLVVTVPGKTRHNADQKNFFIEELPSASIEVYVFQILSRSRVAF